ncbi:MAG: TlpA family protein disulfide reductase [Deltaproteobacteria bacterium]|nr:MAG: TlpA family protein disulfide reductase [Deltaproteobacteria bacterium]
MVNFWATWCPSCVQEIPSLEALNQVMKDKPFEILAVSVDEEGWPAIDSFVKKFPMTFPILLDVQGMVSSQYGTYQLPESYLIDSKGKIIQKYIGSMNWMDPKILGEIQNALKNI